MRHRLVLIVAALVGVCATAQANIVSFSGDTTGSPTFARPTEDLSTISLIGSGVRYSTTKINVSVAGTYSFLTAARFDSFALIYSSSFNPAVPIFNALSANDDVVGNSYPNSSGFTAALTPGIDYFFVNTGFAPTDFGAFAATVGGPGVVTAGAALASLPTGLFIRSGDTTGDPTFLRPVEDLSGYSAFGSDVRYDRFDFTVGTTGDYTFLTTGSFDTFSLLYATAFNPSTSIINAKIANDDLIGPPFTTSGFGATLTAGQHYSLVTTGFKVTDFGAFTVMVAGPGAIQTGVIAAIPSPDTPALLIAGLIAMGWLVRRRRSTRG